MMSIDMAITLTEHIRDYTSIATKDNLYNLEKEMLKQNEGGVQQEVKIGGKSQDLTSLTNVVRRLILRV